jgi:hypothetical protein
MPGRTANVRYSGKIGLNADIGIRAAFDPQAPELAVMHNGSADVVGCCPRAWAGA